MSSPTCSNRFTQVYSSSTPPPPPRKISCLNLSPLCHVTAKGKKRLRSFTMLSPESNIVHLSFINEYRQRNISTSDGLAKTIKKRGGRDRAGQKDSSNWIVWRDTNAFLFICLSLSHSFIWCLRNPCCELRNYSGSGDTTVTLRNLSRSQVG